MALSNDEKRMRILRIIDCHKRELGLVLEANYEKGGPKEARVWQQIMEEARSQGLFTGTSVKDFKSTTWWAWCGETRRKYKQFPYRKRSTLSEYMKFIIVNICGKTIPAKIVTNPGSAGDVEQESSTTPESQSTSSGHEAIDDDEADRTEVHSASVSNSDDADSEMDMAAVLGSPRFSNQNADVGNPARDVGVLNLEGIVRELTEQNKKQVEQLKSHEQRLQQLEQLLKSQEQLLQQQLKMQPQMLPFQPQPWQYAPFIPNQWQVSQTTQAGQPSQVFILDLQNNKDSI